MKISENDFMCLRSGGGYPAWQLFYMEPPVEHPIEGQEILLLLEFLCGRQIAEAAWWILPQLLATRIEINGSSVNATGGPSFESSCRKTKLA